MQLGTRPTATSPFDNWGGGPFSQRRFGFPTVLAHDTTLAPDQCGGPLVDADGNVIGLNIARALRVTSYALTARDAAAAIDEMLSRMKPFERMALDAIPEKGIDGHLILTGTGSVSNDTMKYVTRLAGGDEARLIVIDLSADSQESGNVQQLLQEWQKVRSASLLMLRAKPGDPIPVEYEQALGLATGIWIQGADGQKVAQWLAQKQWKDCLENVLQRDGVLAGGAGLSHVVGLGTLDDQGCLVNGIALCPQMFVDLTAERGTTVQSRLGALEFYPSTFAVQLPPESALWIHGRSMRTIGASPVSLHLPATPNQTAKSVELNGSQTTADLTDWRRLAVTRSQSPEQPEKVITTSQDQR